MDGTIMEVTLKITRSHGRTIPEPNVKVGPVNNVLSSLFESLEMRINDKQITESGDIIYNKTEVLNTIYVKN